MKALRQFTITLLALFAVGTASAGMVPLPLQDNQCGLEGCGFTTCDDYSGLFNVNMPYTQRLTDHHLPNGYHNWIATAARACGFTDGSKLPNGNTQCITTAYTTWSSSAYDSGQTDDPGVFSHLVGWNEIANAGIPGTTSLSLGNAAWTVNDCGTYDPYCTWISIGFNYDFSAKFATNDEGSTGTPIVENQLYPNLDRNQCPDEVITGDSPIAIDLDGENFKDAFTDVQHGVWWDFRENGHPAQVAWVQPGRHIGWLFIDRNTDKWSISEPRTNNGQIDGFKELFGNLTNQPLSDDETTKLIAQYAADNAAGRDHTPFETNGFRALAVFDRKMFGGNEDGKIDKNDKIWSLLKLCQFRPPNVSVAENCQTMEQSGVKSISTSYKASGLPVDKNGNQERYVGAVEMEHPGATAVVIGDWWLATSPYKQ